MTDIHHTPGAAAIGVLNQMRPWEANLVLNLRLWCDGPEGQAQVEAEFCTCLGGDAACREYETFQALVGSLLAAAYRPLIRHEVGCACLGSDEGIFLNLVRTAADGHLRDAALIATLLAGPAHAEQIAMLAARVGTCARKIHCKPREHAQVFPVLH